MNPEENQPFNQSDYLNQIAPVSQNTSFFSQKPMLFAVIGLAVVIILFFVTMLLAGGNVKTGSLEQLSARLDSTEKVVISATPNIKNSQLRALNSNLKIYLTNTIREISPLLVSEKIDVKKIDKKILATEASDEMLSTLEDARLNAIYDRTYAREMSYQLAKTMNLMKQIYKNTSNKKLKVFLDESYKNLQPTQKQFSDFSATNG